MTIGSTDSKCSYIFFWSLLFFTVVRSSKALRSFLLPPAFHQNKHWPSQLQVLCYSISRGTQVALWLLLRLLPSVRGSTLLTYWLSSPSFIACAVQSHITSRLLYSCFWSVVLPASPRKCHTQVPEQVEDNPGGGGGGGDQHHHLLGGVRPQHHPHPHLGAHLGNCHTQGASALSTHSTKKCQQVSTTLAQK